MYQLNTTLTVLSTHHGSLNIHISDWYSLFAIIMIQMHGTHRSMETLLNIQCACVMFDTVCHMTAPTRQKLMNCLTLESGKYFAGINCQTNFRVCVYCIVCFDVVMISEVHDICHYCCFYYFCLCNAHRFRSKLKDCLYFVLHRDSS